MSNKNGRSIYLRELPKHLKPQFKAACALRGKSMKKVLEAFMRNYIRTGRLPSSEVK